MRAHSESFAGLGMKEEILLGFHTPQGSKFNWKQWKHHPINYKQVLPFMESKLSKNFSVLLYPTSGIHVLKIVSDDAIFVAENFTGVTFCCEFIERYGSPFYLETFSPRGMKMLSWGCTHFSQPQRPPPSSSLHHFFMFLDIEVCCIFS